MFTRIIPLLAASIMVVITMVGVFSIWLPVQLSFETKELYGLGAIILVWILFLLKSRIWSITFFIVLFISISGLIKLGPFNFFFLIGTIKVPLIIVALLTSHILLNIDYFNFLKDTSDETNKIDVDTKKNFFVRKYEKMSLTELESIDPDDLVDDARNALLETIQSKKASYPPLKRKE